MLQGELIQQLTNFNGYWHYRGGKLLAQLTSGKISDTFLNCSVLSSRPRLLNYVAKHLIEPLVHEGYFDNEDSIVVVGPAFGSITFAYAVASYLCSCVEVDAQCVFTEPRIENGLKIQELKRFSIPFDSRVLLVEDVITTGGSIVSTCGALPCDASLIPTILALVDRRMIKELTTIDGQTVNIFAAEQIVAKTWDTLEEAKKECPNVEGVVRPKSNWQELVES